MANHQPHAAAIAFPFGSHAAQILNITRKLAAAAPNVTFSFFSTAKSNHSLFGSNVNGYRNIKSYDVYDGIPENHVFSGNPVEEIDLFIKGTPNSFKKAIKTAESETGKKISCVINDAFLWVAVDIAQELGVPCVAVWAPAASSLSTHFYTDLIRQTTNGRNDEYLTFIPGMSSVRASDLQEEIRGNLDSLFAGMLHRAGQILPRATAVAINSFEELEQTVVDDLKSNFKQCLTVGPLTLLSPTPIDPDDPYDCLPWLDTQKPASVAYVSFGTLATPPPHELVALAEGLEESGVPFLWSLKDKVRVHLPDGFLDRTSGRGKVVPWTPQSKVLDHIAVGVNVTHCGWNSVLECIMGGVPMIYRPFFGDHKLIGRFVSDVWKIGVGSKDGVFSKDGVMNDLNLILCDEQGKKLRDNVEALIKEARQAVGPTGSTTKNFKTLLEIITRS